jgi:P4 family phage/plasmid primase-like protien
MSTTSRYKDLKDFINNHRAKDAKAEDGVSELPATHTRIGNKDRGVYGGSWHIPREKLSEFHELYTQAVFIKNKSEFLTERQLQNEKSPLLLDFDFKYDSSVVTRQHNESHVEMLIRLYLDELKDLLLFDEDKPVPVYVMEKPEVNRLEDGTLTKDGIHMYFGVQMNNTLQIILREKMLTILPENDLISALPLTNEWTDILDISISRGTTNWQLYGSQKPGHKPYQLTYWYSAAFDPNDGEFVLSKNNISDFNPVTDFYKLSAQNDSNLCLPMNPLIKQEYEKRTKPRSRGAGSSSPSSSSSSSTQLTSNALTIATNSLETADDFTYDRIISPLMLDKAIAYMIKNLKTKDVEIKEIYQYAMLLPDLFYKPGSHFENRCLAFALKHLAFKLDNDGTFLIWIAVRAKADDFDFSTIPDLHKTWSRHFKERDGGYTERSIIYWAKQYNYDEYMKVKQTTIDYYIDQTEKDATDHDLAMVLHQMFKDTFVCGSKKHKLWFKFKDHRWKEDPNTTLRIEIPTSMNTLYQNRISKIYEEDLINVDETDPAYEVLLKRVSDLFKISNSIRNVSKIDNIMKCAADIFCDEKFMEMRDNNKHLMCFTNGVIDFAAGTFRDGYPQDYITKSTNIPYVPYDEEKNGELIKQITEFWNQLFPLEELANYMWNHCASTLVGENINQTCNIYTGSGSNGKSLLVDLIWKALGDYKASISSQLICGQRVNLGGTCSELIQLKGVRYAVIQELSNTQVINEGPMKELTGGDPIQARQLYCEAETFIPQFNLVVCTNNLPEIKANDDGTWRRIRICPFISKFVDDYTEGLKAELEADNENLPVHEHVHVFPKNKDLKDQGVLWREVFMGMLIKYAFQNKGIVKDCDIVMAYSKKYRQSQDNISAFVGEMLRKKAGSKVRPQELIQQFKLWNDSKTLPKGVKEDIYNLVDKKFGRRKSGGPWCNVEIIYPNGEDEEEQGNSFEM